jgi:serralysin
VYDTIDISRTAFTGVSASFFGRLSSSQFWSGTAAHDSSDRLVYNPATGALLYDADGNGAGAAQQIATLAPGLALSYADFNVF